MKIAAGLLLLCCLAAAQTAVNAPQEPAAQTAAHTPEEQKIIGLERLWLVGGGLLAPEFIAITPGGAILNASDLQGAKLPGLAVEDATVRIVGDTAVLVAHLVPQGKSATALDASNVFIKQDGRWKMLAAHLSPH